MLACMWIAWHFEILQGLPIILSESNMMVLMASKKHAAAVFALIYQCICRVCR